MNLAKHEFYICSYYIADLDYYLNNKNNNKIFTVPNNAINSNFSSTKIVYSKVYSLDKFAFASK